MKSICIYFQVHQPYRLNEFTFFDLGKKSKDYYNEELNKQVLQKVSSNCYLPGNDLFNELCIKYPQLKLSYALSGTLVTQFKQYAPEVLQSFQKLFGVGNQIEVLAETFYHSLSAFYSESDFVEQVAMHSELMQNEFDRQPTFFRNTELTYHNEVADLLAEKFSFKGVFTEGSSWSLNGYTPNHVFSATQSPLKILLRNSPISDDIGFRFTDEQWSGYPLTPTKLLKKISQEEGDIVCIAMDYETIGEHHHKSTGIFEFWKDFIEQALEEGYSFKTPTEAVTNYSSVDTYNVPMAISWADAERDLSAWNGNSLQKEAISKVYNLEPEVRKKNDPALLAMWHKLTTSDHFYYLSTKQSSDGEVHSYFSPYDSPYDAYIYLMNVISDINIHLKKS